MNDVMIGEKSTRCYIITVKERRPKHIFHSFHSLMVIKNTAISTCDLTPKIMEVKVCVVQGVFFSYAAEIP